MYKISNKDIMYSPGNYNDLVMGTLRWHSYKEFACQCRRHRRCEFNPCIRKIPWRRKWLPTPLFLPGKFLGQRSLVGYDPWDPKESDKTE